MFIDDPFYKTPIEPPVSSKFPQKVLRQGQTYYLAGLTSIKNEGTAKQLNEIVQIAKSIFSPNFLHDYLKWALKLYGILESDKIPVYVKKTTRESRELLERAGIDKTGSCTKEEMKHALISVIKARQNRYEKIFTKPALNAPLLGRVNYVAGEFGFWMDGLAVIASRLSEKYKLKDLYVCETLEAFVENFQAFSNGTEDGRRVYIVGVASSGSASWKKGASVINFPQHKVPVCVEMKNGKLKIAVLNSQKDTFNHFHIEGKEDLWEGSDVPWGFSSSDLICRAILHAKPPKSDLYLLDFDRQFGDGCAIFALRDAISFLRRANFFDVIRISPNVTTIDKKLSVYNILALPPEHMIGTHSAQVIESYIEDNPKLSAEEFPGKPGKSLIGSIGNNKWVKVEGKLQNHDTTHKLLKYLDFVVDQAEMLSSKELIKFRDRTFLAGRYSSSSLEEGIQCFKKMLSEGAPPTEIAELRMKLRRHVSFKQRESNLNDDPLDFLQKMQIKAFFDKYTHFKKTDMPKFTWEDKLFLKIIQKPHRRSEEVLNKLKTQLFKFDVEFEKLDVDSELEKFLQLLDHPQNQANSLGINPKKASEVFAAKIYFDTLLNPKALLYRAYEDGVVESLYQKKFSRDKFNKGLTDISPKNKWLMAGPIQPLHKNNHGELVDQILANSYFGSLNKYTAEVILEEYTKGLKRLVANKYLNPLMNALAKAVKAEKINMLFTQEDSVKNMTQVYYKTGEAKSTTVGRYNNRHTVFISNAASLVTNQEVLKTFSHETTHMVIKLIMGNCSPVKIGSPEAEKFAEAIMSDMLLQKSLDCTKFSMQERSVWHSFVSNLVLNENYFPGGFDPKKSTHMNTMMEEVVARLSEELIDNVEVVKKICPKTCQFYEEHVIPLFNTYAQDQS